MATTWTITKTDNSQDHITCFAVAVTPSGAIACLENEQNAIAFYNVSEWKKVHKSAIQHTDRPPQIVS